MARADREEFLANISLGFIPAGTGNGLVAHIMECQGETGDPILTCAFHIAKGRQTRMDLSEVKLEYLQNDESRKNIYMFLSLTWAFIADVDINSEALRCIGAARFTVYGAFRMLNVRRYGGKIDFKGARLLTNNNDDRIPNEQF